MTTQQQRSEETKTHLLQAAELSFAQQGYDGTSVATICRRAGVSKGAFYHHFESKQAVFLELLNRWLDNLDLQLETMRIDTDDIPQGLLSMTGVVGEVFQTAADQLPIYLEFWRQATHDPQILSAMIQPFHRYRVFFAQMIQDGVAEGTLEAVNPDSAARVIISVAVGLLLQGLLEPRSTDWEALPHESIQILLGGLLKR
jgi:AcrR family transcriptional regulator